MDNKNVKQKRKKQSLSGKLKKLQEHHRNLEDRYEKLWENFCENRDRLWSLEGVCPVKYYKINFKIMANDKNTITFSEIIKEYTPALAIKKLLYNKTHPKTFELLDIKLLA